MVKSVNFIKAVHPRKGCTALCFGKVAGVVMIAAAVLCGCSASDGRTGNGTGQPERDIRDIKEVATAGKADMTGAAALRADSMLALLTLEERVGQLFMPTVYASDDAASMMRLRKYIADWKVGGIVLLKGDLKSAATMAEEGASAPVPLWIAIDAEWGLGMRLRDAPDFPKNGSLGESSDEPLMYDYGREVARECRRAGINMVLGPVVDVAAGPEGVMGRRSFGSDPRKVADLGVAYARGIESGGVASVAKHFPGHGSPVADSHRELPVISRDFAALDSIDLYPFRKYAGSGLSGIMAGHLAVPSVDASGRPAAVSRAVISGLLRDSLRFGGLVLTDALNMKGAGGYGASDALLAGADIVVGPADTEKEIRRVTEDVIGRRIHPDTIAARCRRVLFYKCLFGLGCGISVPHEGIAGDVAEGAGEILRRMGQ